MYKTELLFLKSFFYNHADLFFIMVVVLISLVFGFMSDVLGGGL